MSEVGGRGYHQILKTRVAWCVIRSADHYDFAKMSEVLPRNGLELWQKRFANDGYSCEGIIEDVLVIARFSLRVNRNGDGADFDGTEEGVKEFGCIE